MSEAYVHGFNLVLEGVRQIRGTSTSQVDGADVSLVTSGEGVPTSALLLTRDARERAGRGSLLPDLDDPTSGPFWAGTARGELLVQACATCGRVADAAAADVPALPLDSRSTWVADVGRGTVWSFVVAHPPLLPAYAELAPYNVVIVALDEDPTIRFVGNLVTGPDGSIGEIDPAIDHDRRTRPRRLRPRSTTSPSRGGCACRPDLDGEAMWSERTAGTNEAAATA